MQITIFSFFISIVWSSILIIAIYLCRKTRFFIYQFGVTSMVLLYLFCVIRMVFPLDFPFTKGLLSDGVFRDVYENIAIGNDGISKSHAMLELYCIWIEVSVLLMFRFICQYYTAMRTVSSYYIRKDEQCKRVFERVINNSKRQMKIDVRCSGDVNIPIGIGVFKKSIVLPEEVYSDKELYCILMHEYTHFLNRDLLVKILINIFCCVFWWNPIVYLLRRDFNQTLEIKCDLCVTEQMDNIDKADYLTTIVSFLKKADTAKKKTLLYGTTGLISKNCKLEIVERFKIVSENHKLQRKNKVLTTVCLFAFLAIFIFSYSFVVLPYYGASTSEAALEVEVDKHKLHSDNAYIIKNKRGIYTLVMSNGRREKINEKNVPYYVKNRGLKIIERVE